MEGKINQNKVNVSVAANKEAIRKQDEENLSLEGLCKKLINTSSDYISLLPNTGLGLSPDTQPLCLRPSPGSC